MAYMRGAYVYYTGTNRYLLKNLLEQNKSVAIHTRNLQMLATEIFKVYQKIITPPIFSEIFHRRDINYKLWINSEIAMPNVRSVFNVSESILYLGSKIWDVVHLELKELTCWLPTTSILVVIRRFYHYQFECNYLENQKHFTAFLLHFRIYIKFWIFWNKMSVIALVFLKLLTPDNVVT